MDTFEFRNLSDSYKSRLMYGAIKKHGLPVPGEVSGRGGSLIGDAVRGQRHSSFVCNHRKLIEVEQFVLDLARKALHAQGRQGEFLSTLLQLGDVDAALSNQVAIASMAENLSNEEPLLALLLAAKSYREERLFIEHFLCKEAAKTIADILRGESGKFALSSITTHAEIVTRRGSTPVGNNHSIGSIDKKDESDVIRTFGQIGLVAFYNVSYMDIDGEGIASVSVYGYPDMLPSMRSVSDSSLIGVIGKEPCDFGLTLMMDRYRQCYYLCPREPLLRRVWARSLRSLMSLWR